MFVNNFKYVVLVFSRWMQDGFSYCYSNPIFWEHLLDLPARQYHYRGREASPTNASYLKVNVALHQVLRRRRATKDLSRHAQQPTGNVKNTFYITWTFGYKSALVYEIGSVSVLTIQFATHLSTSCWEWQVIHVFCFHVINYRYFGFTFFTRADTR